MNKEAQSSPSPMMRVEGVSFAYGTRVVLEDITFDISSGDFLAVIGPNGSGKTTLLKLLLGILQPKTGRITILGETFKTFHRWDIIGYVPQKMEHMDPIFPISVAEVVGLGRLAGKSFPKWLTREDRNAVELALTTVGMTSFADARIGDLSGGQQQRVFIARAIVNDPKILFLDEPTTGIDAGSQEDFYGLLDELNRQGITIVLITHDIGMVNKHVHQVACLNQRLFYHGTHDEFCSSAKLQTLFGGEHHIVLHRH